MSRVHTTVIGGGQAGLAVSRCLTDHGVAHVVLERGSVGQRWRERRRGLRLLTPNWMSRLPGWTYDGGDPDGFMTMPEVAGFLERYASSFSAPVATGTTVVAVDRAGDGYRVRTDRGEITSDNVVVATGACDRPAVPGFARLLDPRIAQLTPATYRHPAGLPGGGLPGDGLPGDGLPGGGLPGDGLPGGGVLVVGASASGAQIAAELRAAGREVVLAAGRHVRLPRRYRGRDIHHWLDRLGVLRRPVEPGAGAWSALSAQLVGSPERRDVDLATLQRAGVVLTGRLTGAGGTRVWFAGDLHRHVADADRRLVRLLHRIDGHIDDTDRHAAAIPAALVRPVAPGPVPRELDLVAAGIGTVIWATGYRRRYPWLRVPVLGPDGEIRHERGVTPAPGLYVIGLPLQSRRNSTFIDGVGHDAVSVTRHITRRADRPAAILG